MEQTQKIIKDQKARIAHLEYLAVTDEATGLLNRKGFYEQLSKELDRAARNSSVGGLLVLIDIDNYPTIEKQFGRAALGNCLRLIGRTLSHEVRTMDAAARLSNDEFVLLLADTKKQDAVSRAQKLAWNLNRLSFVWEGNEIRLHTSVSLKTYQAGDTPKILFKEKEMFFFDRAMKHSRNTTQTRLLNKQAGITEHSTHMHT